ncbi:MAG: choice-of-anchor tandem repeat GloVer-containing protein [Terriglobales bacterium]
MMQITVSSIARSALVLGLASLMAAATLGTQTAPPIAEKVIYSFAGGSDGATPEAGLLRDSKGNLYGTTESGGVSSFGTVFAITSAGEKVVYAFTGGADGGNPQSTLVRDAQGHLYGVAFNGGAHGFGAVFEITGLGKEKVLYSFTGGADGSHPRGGLIRDASGNLYGTTGAGGNFGSGTVFVVSPSGVETVLHHFNNADGAFPYAPMIADATGTMYGTTLGGGQHNIGTVFKVTQSGTLTSLYSFGSVQPDGFEPKTPVIVDAQGNLYGVTEGGGNFGYGIVFELTSAGAETILYTFTGGADGRYPDGGLLRDAKGNLYGTTSDGGNFTCAPSCGVVYQVTPAAVENVLFSFTQTDGAAPFAGLIPDGKGGGYGTTSGGGAHNLGTVFRVGP